MLSRFGSCSKPIATGSRLAGRRVAAAPQADSLTCYLLSKLPTTYYGRRESLLAAAPQTDSLTCYVVS